MTTRDINMSLCRTFIAIGNAIAILARNRKACLAARSTDARI